MNRAIEHAAFASNLAADATSDLAAGDAVAAYKKLYTARTELEAAIAHIQIHDPRAVWEANRATPRQHLASPRVEDEVLRAHAG